MFSLPYFLKREALHRLRFTIRIILKSTYVIVQQSNDTCLYECIMYIIPIYTYRHLTRFLSKKRRLVLYIDREGSFERWRRRRTWSEQNDKEKLSIFLENSNPSIGLYSEENREIEGSRGVGPNVPRLPRASSCAPSIWPPPRRCAPPTGAGTRACRDRTPVAPRRLHCSPFRGPRSCCNGHRPSDDPQTPQSARAPGHLHCLSRRLLVSAAISAPVRTAAFRYRRWIFFQDKFDMNSLWLFFLMNAMVSYLCVTLLFDFDNNQQKQQKERKTMDFTCFDRSWTAPIAARSWCHFRCVDY